MKRGAIQNIWIIDDNEIDTFILESMLSKMEFGAMVHCASHGRKAIDWLTKGSMDFPEFIFLDINMPMMDGFAFLVKWESLGFNGKSKIIMLSSSSRVEDKQETLSFKDVIDYIEKPPSLQKLKRLFETHFGKDDMAILAAAQLIQKKHEQPKAYE